MKLNEDDDDAPADPDAHSRHPPGRGAAAEDRRLVRAAMDVFRAIQRTHPTARIGTVDSIASRTAASVNGEPIPYVETCEATWTPLDSDKRAGQHADLTRDKEAKQEMGKDLTARGSGADWRRFRALVKCVGGRPEMLDELCRGAEIKERKASKRGFDDEDEKVAKSRGALLDEPEGSDVDDADAEGTQKKKKGKGSKEGATNAGPYPGYVPPRLGAALAFTHAVDVIAADAAARIAVFERRVQMQNEKDAADASVASNASVGTTPSRLGPGRDQSMSAVPESQDSDVVPESPDVGATPSQQRGPDLNARGNWALGVLQNSLLYRLVGLAPGGGECAALIQDVFELAGFAADDAARRAPSSKRATEAEAPMDPSPGCEDAGVDAIGAAAHTFLARLGDLLDLMEPASGTSDRRLLQLRETVDDRAAGFWRCTGGLIGASNPEVLRETEAKRVFMSSMCGGVTNGGTTSSATRRLRLVRTALRHSVVSRQAPGIMIPGLGREKDGEGAKDVFDYVAKDAKTAIKSQKLSEGSADFRESVGRLGLMLGASAQAAQAMCTGPPKYEGSLRAGVKAFVREATENDGLRPEIAACVTAAIGTVTAA